jgi:hypothetical protein
MFRLNSEAHGLADPTPAAAISLCSVSAVLFLVFYVLTGYNHAATQQMAVYIVYIPSFYSRAKRRRSIWRQPSSPSVVR